MCTNQATSIKNAGSSAVSTNQAPTEPTSALEDAAAAAAMLNQMLKGLKATAPTYARNYKSDRTPPSRDGALQHRRILGIMTI